MQERLVVTIEEDNILPILKAVVAKYYQKTKDKSDTNTPIMRLFDAFVETTAMVGSSMLVSAKSLEEQRTAMEWILESFSKKLVKATVFGKVVLEEHGYEVI
jgi:hypothetical protein